MAAIMTQKPLSPVEDEFIKNVEQTATYDSTRNQRYTRSFSSVFENALSDQDKAMLGGMDCPDLNYGIVRPYMFQMLKNVYDSSPSAAILPMEDNETDPTTQLPESTIAEILTKELREIYKKNHFKDVVYNCSLNAAAGGFGVYKIDTVYQNSYDFRQNFHIENVIDPENVHFDPAAKKPTKSDASYYFHIIRLDEDHFKEQFPKLNFDEIVARSDDLPTNDFHWADSLANTDKKVVSIADYYYKKHKTKTIYELPNGKTVEEPPENPKRIKKTREIPITEIWRTRFSSHQVITPPQKTNFHENNYIFQVAENWRKDGQDVIVPYVEHALDSQRTKNFAMNFFLKGALQQGNAKIMVAKGSVSKEGMMNLREPNKNSVIEYEAFAKAQDPLTGQSMANPLPGYLPPPPLQTQYVDVFTNMDQAIEKSLGAQFPTDNEKELSGKALYNLADYRSGSNALFMQNLNACLQQIGCVILGAFPDLLETRKLDFMGPIENIPQQVQDQEVTPSAQELDAHAAMQPASPQGVQWQSSPMGRIMPQGQMGQPQIPQGQPPQGQPSPLSGQMPQGMPSGAEGQAPPQNGSPPPLRKFQHNYQFIFDALRYKLVITPGVNYKLQQQASVEKLMQLAQQLPTFGQFLGSSPGLELMLKNLDINDKDEWIDEYKQFAQSQQGGQAQQQQAQQMMMQAHQAEMQSKQTASQAKMVDAQANQQKIQLQMAELQQEAQTDTVAAALKMKEINADREKLHLEAHNTTQDRLLRDKHFKLDKVFEVSKLITDS